MTSEAEWVIGEPENHDTFWSINVGTTNDDILAEIHAPSAEECRRLAQLFKSAEAMKDALEAAKRTIDAWDIYAEMSPEMVQMRAALRLSAPPSEGK